MLRKVSNLSMRKCKTLVKPNSAVYRAFAVVPRVSAQRLPSVSTLGSRSFSVETREFQAETRKLLDIVTHSIYTDKEVFLRELVSNASDSLEKYRYMQVTGGTAASPEAESPLEINIITDAANNTLTIIDNGIGMSKDELVSNLGTIARSGSKNFVEQLKGADSSNRDVTDGIIGQFGVGFYSSFMVSDRVSVESVSATTGQDPHKWSSDGSGVFSIESVESVPGMISSTRGSKITMHLKESCKEYSDPERIKT